MSAKAQLRFQLIRYRTITSDITSIVIGQLCLVDGHLQKLYARTKCITFYGENLPCVCNDCAWQRYWKVRSYECYIQSFKQIAPYTQLFHTPVAFCAPSNRLLLIRSLLLIFGAHVSTRQLRKPIVRAMVALYSPINIRKHFTARTFIHLLSRNWKQMVLASPNIFWHLSWRNPNVPINWVCRDKKQKKNQKKNTKQTNKQTNKKTFPV